MAKEFSKPLIAGGGSTKGAMLIGEVTLLLQDDGQLIVTYQLDESFANQETSGDSRDDWSLSEIHFDFGSEQDSIPVTRAGNPQIGRFDFGGKTVTFLETGDSSVIRFSVEDVALSDLNFWAAHATISQRDAVEAFNESLPEQVTLRMTDGPSPGDDSYWKTTVTSPEETWLDGTFNGWCVDTGRTIATNTTYTANVYSSLEGDLSGVVDKGLNFDRVNWLLNNAELLVGETLYDEVSYGSSHASPEDYENGGEVSDLLTGTGTGNNLGEITYGDIQRAIWGLIDNTTSTAGLSSWSSARADEIADRAYIEGRGFNDKLDCDDQIAVIFQPINASGETSHQVTIAQVTLVAPGGSCDGREETAWAIDGGPGGLGGLGSFGGSSWAEYNQVPQLLG